MNWEDILKNEDEDLGYWENEETGEPIRNFDYGGKQENWSKLNNTYDGLARTLKAYLKEAKKYVEAFNRDNPEERAWSEQYDAAFNLVSVIEGMLPSLEEVGEKIPKINHHWREFLAE